AGLRGSNWAVPAGHVLVRNARLAENIERVVVLGRPTLQRSIAGLLVRTDSPVLVVSQWADWTDVAGTAAQIYDDVTVPGEPTPSEQQWWHRWQRAARAAQQVLAAPADPSAPTDPSTPADHSTPAEPNEAHRPGRRPGTAECSRRGDAGFFDGGPARRSGRPRWCRAGCSGACQPRTCRDRRHDRHRHRAGAAGQPGAGADRRPDVPARRHL